MGLMMRRNLMAGKSLPYLRRVAYLESHGTEWIDTGWIGSKSVDVNFVATMTKMNVAYAAFFGARSGSMSREFQIYGNELYNSLSLLGLEFQEVYFDA